jgi:hypothetical protein
MLRSHLRTAVLLAVVAVPAIAAAQVPVPFPRPGQPPVAPPVAPPTTTVPGQPTTPPKALAAGEPSEATLGVPLYPGAQFIASYDAGRGQRYYLFGAMADYAQIVGYYRNMLKDRGDVVFEEPPVHMFDIGRFREETMAFPPSVTVKDYTWGGSQGYLNPKRGVEPARFKTVIQIVPAPPGAAK